MSRPMLRFAQLFCLLLGGVFSAFSQEKGGVPAPLSVYAHMETTRGTLIFFLPYAELPTTVSAFMRLAEEPAPYYKGTVFYHDIPSYAILGGAKEESLATYPLDKETSSLSHDRAGTLSMMGKQGKISDCLFFIIRRPDPVLDQKHQAFGYLVSGKKTLSRLREGDIVTNLTIVRKKDKKDQMKLAHRGRQGKSSAKPRTGGTGGAALERMLSSLGPHLKESDSGLFYVIVKEGKGKKPLDGETLRIHYTGIFLDGRTFDSSVDRGEPFQLVMSSQLPVIKGWQETIPQMRVGEKRTIVVPPALGYGSRQIGTIPPNSWLVFSIELLSAD